MERRTAAAEATLVCVHGGLDRATSFSRLTRRAERFDVVAYDRRGYQGSRGRGPLTLAGNVEDLLAVARTQAPRGPVIYFGHSFGGLVAIAAALAEPTLVSLVVAYESPLPWVLARPGGYVMVSDDPAVEAESFFCRVVSPGAWDRLGEPERQSRRLDGPALVADLAVLDRDAPIDLAELAVPTAYVHGEQYRPDYFRQLGTELERMTPRISAHELSGVGHGAHLSAPDQLYRLLEQLWEEQCA